MTDKEKLVALLTGWGVDFEVAKIAGETSSLHAHWSITVTKHWTPNHPQNKITGYEGFFTQFDFDANGKFIEMGAWE